MLPLVKVRLLCCRNICRQNHRLQGHHLLMHLGSICALRMVQRDCSSCNQRIIHLLSNAHINMHLVLKSVGKWDLDGTVTDGHHLISK